MVDDHSYTSMLLPVDPRNMHISNNLESLPSYPHNHHVGMTTSIREPENGNAYMGAYAAMLSGSAAWTRDGSNNTVPHALWQNISTARFTRDPLEGEDVDSVVHTSATSDDLAMNILDEAIDSSYPDFLESVSPCMVTPRPVSKIALSSFQVTGSHEMNKHELLSIGREVLGHLNVGVEANGDGNADVFAKMQKQDDGIKATQNEGAELVKLVFGARCLFCE